MKPTTSFRFGAFALAASVLVGCSGGAQVPKGPAPEYEEPPRPSWFDAGGAPASLAPAPTPAAPAAPTTTDAPDAG